jgi:hypothetical protein
MGDPATPTATAHVAPGFVLLVCSRDGDLLVARASPAEGGQGSGSCFDLPVAGPLPANCKGDPTEHVLAAARTCLLLPAVPIHFATIFEACPGAEAGLPDAPLTLTWVFFCTLSDAGWTPPPPCTWVPAAELPQAAYTRPCSPLLSRVLRTFCPLGEALDRLRKVTVPRTSAPLWELQDFHVLQPCYYIFDNPGKGVRSKAVQALADIFAIHHDDLEHLKLCVDRFHELSLIVDDIEDFSDRRRDRECAHIRFGVRPPAPACYLPRSTAPFPRTKLQGREGWSRDG